MPNKIIEIALAQYGQTGIIGKNSNKIILDYFHEIGATWIQDDDTAWCSAFVNWVLKKANLPYSSRLNARSFLTYGNKTTKPKISDIVILWRVEKNSVYGHCGFYVSENADSVFILGGNQDNSVNIKSFSKDKVLDYRTI